MWEFGDGVSVDLVFGAVFCVYDLGGAVDFGVDCGLCLVIVCGVSWGAACEGDEWE